MKSLFILGVSIAVPILANAVVSPTYWATIPVGNKYIGVIKIGLGVATFVFLHAITAKKN